MSLVQKEAPEFQLQAVMPDGSFQSVSLSDYRGKYVVLFFYALDFSFVCPTEITAFSDAISEFEQRDVQLLSASIDSHFTHLAWRNTPREAGGLGNVKFPMLADLNKKVSEQYGVLLSTGIALRGLFLIDRDGVVRHETINDLTLGRNIEEALRMVDALQYFEQHGEVCPANWRQGGATIKPNAEQCKEYFMQANLQRSS